MIGRPPSHCPFLRSRRFSRLPGRWRSPLICKGLRYTSTRLMRILRFHRRDSYSFFAQVLLLEEPWVLWEKSIWGPFLHGNYIRVSVSWFRLHCPAINFPLLGNGNSGQLPYERAMRHWFPNYPALYYLAHRISLTKLIVRANQG